MEAQQARSLLDKLVGYRLSPVLWRKVKTGLSAGRVQSVAVRMVVDKEKEIQAFVSEEFWKIEAIMNGNKSQSFKANLETSLCLISHIKRKRGDLHLHLSLALFNKNLLED